MKNIRLLLICSCISLLSIQVRAEAPVVDESENFALLDNPQAAIDQPLAKPQFDFNDSDEEPALAFDTPEPDIIPEHQNSLLLNKVQALQQEIQELRGQLEIQAHSLKVLQDQQIAFYKDIDARLNPNHNQPVATNPPKTAIEPTQVKTAHKLPVNDIEHPSSTNPIKPSGSAFRLNPADEQISYLAAYELVKQKKYDDAVSAMQSFVKQYPQSGYTANAEYWLGELFMVKNNYPQAIEHFEHVLQRYPTSGKTAASLLKIGYALAAVGKTDAARQRLQQVVKNFPDTKTAELAAAKLHTLDS